MQVFHGLVGLKTHCKLSLLVRRDPDGVTRSYAHIGTGNYNATTARIYTDLSLFTANPEITRAVHDVFSFLTAYAENPSYEPLLVAPLDLAEKCVALIDREAEHARQGQAGAHYREDERAARQEHHPGALPRVAGGSADRSDYSRHMRFAPGRARRKPQHTRAKHRRTLSGTQPNLLFCKRRRRRNLHGQCRLDAAQPVRARGSDVPLRDEMLRSRVRHEILDAYLADNRKARVLLSDATYIPVWQPVHGKRNRRPPVGAAAFSAQDFLMGVAEGKSPALMPASPAPQRRKVTVGRER